MLKEIMTLHQIQCQMAKAIMRPLIDDGMQKEWLDGSSTENFISQFIRPNKNLSSLERLEIYNQQYWIRLLDSLQEDFPGLQSILGDEKFESLCTAYLLEYPSRSFLLNSLGNNLAKFIVDNKHFVEPEAQLAYQLASFEFAEVAAYSAQAKLSLTKEYLQGKDPAQLTLQLQPHISILELNYELDDFILQLEKPADKFIESNAFIQKLKKNRVVSLPNKTHIFVAVYRMDNIVYFKRLKKDQYNLLKSLTEGKTLAQACQELILAKRNSTALQSLPKKLNQYFAEWMEEGWFCE